MFKKSRLKARPVFWLGITGLFFAFFLLLAERSLVPTLISVSEAEVTRIINEAIVDAVGENIAGLLKEEKILNFETNQNGELLFVTTNASWMNKIQARSLEAVQTALADLCGFTVKVPFGQILGSKILAALGPPIKVKMLPVGFCTAHLLDSFEVCGINQTKYNVFLRVSCEVRVIVPFIESHKKILTDIPVTTLLVPGKVPDTYLSFPNLN